MGEGRYESRVMLVMVWWWVVRGKAWLARSSGSALAKSGFATGASLNPLSGLQGAIGEGEGGEGGRRRVVIEGGLV